MRTFVPNLSVKFESNEKMANEGEGIVVTEDEDDDQQKCSIIEGSQKNEDLLLTFDPIALKYVGRRVDPCIQRKYTKIGESWNMCFKLVKSDSKLVRAILSSYGFLQCSPKNQKCNLLWTNTHLSTTTMRGLKQWQRMNHFPRSWMLTRKDFLYENVERTAIQYGREWFDFIPDFFCTPLNEESAQKLREQCAEIEAGQAAPFIVKPVGGSFGRGIFFLDKLEQISSLNNNQRLLISRYIERPLLLVNGLKWDLRIYVLVTSFYPLIVYVYSEGLARFAVHKYEHVGGKPVDLEDVNRHLTNYSLNKASDQFVRNTDCTVENQGHKWTLGALLRDLDRRGVDTGLLMVRIEDIVVKSLLSIQPKVAAMCRKLNLHPKCCFELFGFDILVDEELKPWLLEVNLSPSLTCDSPLDSLLKSHLFCNVLNIAQIPLVSDLNAKNDCYIELEENGEMAEQMGFYHDDQDIATSSSSTNASLPPSSSSSNSNSATTSTSIQKSASNESSDEQQRHQSPKRSKFSPQRASKIHYSADRITPQYLERVKCLFEKLKSEEKRSGNFNRIFPRKTTWDMYSLILEDCGQEQWDKALQTQLADEFGEQNEFSMRDINLAHEQLMNASKFQTREQLDPIVRDFLLADALRDADCYKRKMYAGDLQPYPSALPKLRPNVRRRTQSMVQYEEARKRKAELRKAAESDAANSSPAAGGPLVEMDMNKQQMDEQQQKKQLASTSERLKKNEGQFV